MIIADIFEKALNFEFLTAEEGMHIFTHAPLTELMFVANLANR
jgi:cyclic dehypoxanthinyl futalosine synthase